jgi:hypothetical protein
MKPCLVVLAALALGACATVQSYDAAGDVHALLIAIRDQDKAAFDAHVDRPALKSQLRARLMAGFLRQGDAKGDAGALGVMLAGPLVDIAVDALVQPSVFLAVAEAKGYSPSRPIPGRAAIAAAIRPLGEGRVCVFTKRDGPCVLDFQDEGGVWRLVAFEGDPGMLRLGK